MADHDQVHAEVLGEAADFLDGLAHGEVAGGLEAFLGQRPDAFVEHDLGALFLLLEELFGHESFGEKEAGRHARHGEQVRLGMVEHGELGALEKRALALLGAVVGEENLLILHAPPPYLARSPTRAIVARSSLKVAAAHFA